MADADSFVTLWNARTLGRETSTAVDGVAMNSGVLAVGASLHRVVLLSIPDLTDTAELQHDGDVRSLSFSPLDDMLAGGGAEDTHGLMTHKTRGSETKVVIWRVSPNKTRFNQTFAVLLGHHPLTFLLLGANTCRSPSGQAS